MFRFCVSFIGYFFIPVCSPGQYTICWLHYLPRYQPFCFSLNRHCIFAGPLFFFFLAWTYLNMFLSHVLLIFHSSVLVCYKKLSRAIHLYIFSRPAGAQLADCVTYLATNHFVSVGADNCLSASSLVLYIYTFFSLNMSKHLSFLCFIHLLFLHSSVPP